MQNPGFYFYPGDYLRDTQMLSEKCQVAYDRIMCAHMKNICITQAQLKFFTKRMNDDEIGELMCVLEEGPNGYIIPWVAESIAKTRAYSESRRNNRIKSKITHDNHMLTHVEHMEKEREIEKEKEKEEVKEKEDEKPREVEALEILTGSVVEVWPTFEDFWNLYAKKTGPKDRIKKKFDGMSQKARERIMRHVEVYVASTPDPQFRKNPETYLNQKEYENDYLPTTKTGKRSSDRALALAHCTYL